MDKFPAICNSINVIIANNTITPDFFTAAILSLLVAVISLKLKFLTLSGVFAASVMALFIFGFGQWKWTIPMFTFFFLSSLLSKFRGKRNPLMDTFFDKSGQRDYKQVLANGGFAALLVIINFFYPSELFYYAYVSSIASVCADTWATELGTINPVKTYNILNLKEVEQGRSGAVSINGLFAALCGALVIALSAMFWIQTNSLIIIFLILLAGFAASIIDSVLGASLQVQYTCLKCRKLTERKIHCGISTEKTKGKFWMTNDTVNLITSLTGGIIGLVLIDLISY